MDRQREYSAGIKGEAEIWVQKKATTSPPTAVVSGDDASLSMSALMFNETHRDHIRRAVQAGITAGDRAEQSDNIVEQAGDRCGRAGSITNEATWGLEGYCADKDGGIE